jgi:predicted HicB family RNase H-like nuclease
LKRIIKGVTYNTDTSTQIARKDGECNGGNRYFATLYQTRGGAFFLDSVENVRSFDEHTSETRVVDHKNTFVPLSQAEAKAWYLEGESEIFVDAFGEVPEATSEMETEAGVYIRLPILLKTRIEDAAEHAGLSLNAWAIRCFENGAGSLVGVAEKESPRSETRRAGKRKNTPFPPDAGPGRPPARLLQSAGRNGRSPRRRKP